MLQLVILAYTTLSGPYSILLAQPYWNQFRGPQGDGETQAPLPTEFGDELNVAWKTPIHDKGWSSPVVWGKQIWMTTATEDGKQLFAVCVNADTGTLEHDLLVFEVAEPKFCHPTNSYASGTPYVEEGRVYVHFGEYGTACLDTATGEKLWERRDFVCEDFRGPASSPIVVGDRLFIQFDGVDHQFVVALDKLTGKTLWQTDRNIDYGTDEGDYKKAYGTPSLIEFDGQQQLVCLAAMEAIAYQPDSGVEIWRVRHEGYNGSARPLFKQGLVYLASGGRGESALLAVRPDGQGDVSESHIAWNTGKAVPRFASQVVVDGRLFMVNDTGVISCLDAATGDSIWSERVGGAYWGSPLISRGRLYFFSKEGAALVVAAEDKYRLIAESHFPEGFNASPAVVQDSLIVRGYKHLYRISDPPP